jgi:hypothetical protein
LRREKAKAIDESNKQYGVGLCPRKAKTMTRRMTAVGFRISDVSSLPLNRSWSYGRYWRVF